MTNTHEARREVPYADRSLLWTHGQKTEDELLQRIWNLANDVKVLAADLVEARAVAERTREALRYVEWCYDGADDRCPSCGMVADRGHDSSCRTAKALAAAVPDPEGEAT
jgi:hypothetical protein